MAAEGRGREAGERCHGECAKCHKKGHPSCWAECHRCGRTFCELHEDTLNEYPENGGIWCICERCQQVHGLGDGPAGVGGGSEEGVAVPEPADVCVDPVETLPAESGEGAEERETQPATIDIFYRNFDRNWYADHAYLAHTFQ